MADIIALFHGFVALMASGCAYSQRSMPASSDLATDR